MSIYVKPLGLYIGCGTDVNIMSKLSNELCSCIYMDSRPFTYNGDFVEGDIYSNTEILSQKYMKDFKQSANNEGFKKISIDGVYPHVYKNYNTNQLIYHYFNLSFPFRTIKNNFAANSDEIKKLINQLNGVSHLILIGYSPHYSIVKYIINPITFIGDDTTLYTDNMDNLLDNEKEKITTILQKNLYNVRHRFNKYIYFNKSNIRKEVTNYDNFILLTKSN